MDSNKEMFLEIFNTIDFPKVIDHPNILIAARFWEEERFQAAKTCYGLMRGIDDLIDNYKAAHKEIIPAERNGFKMDVKNWMEEIRKPGNGNPFHQKMVDTFQRFRIPLWTMEVFAKSMMYDIDHDGFSTLETFLEYAGGASVAPASVFVHLTGLTKNEDTFDLPLFDVREVATPCAIFSYLVHIIRDFQKDQLNNLTYFADELVTKHRLTRSDLREMALGRPVNAEFRALIRDYYSLAEKYRIETFRMLEKTRPLVATRYQLSLEIIFDLYVMVFERIHPDSGNFTTAELNPTPEETRERVLRKILDFEY
jgi:phytoene/squalene synthetase